MLEEILDRRNLEKALVQVTGNKGSGGIDGMQTDELGDYLNSHYPVSYTHLTLPTIYSV